MSGEHSRVETAPELASPPEQGAAQGPRPGAPWLEAIAARWAAFASHRPPGEEALQRILDAAESPLRLVPPARGAGSYEARLARGELPCRRGSWHDAFNTIAFVRFPRAKRALHARVLALQAARPKGRRSREEDTLSVLDEATLLVAAERAGVIELEAARQRSLVQLDEAMHRCALAVSCFGHALLEHLALARGEIGAGLLVVEVDASVAPVQTRLDGALAALIAAGGLEHPAFGPTVPWPHPLVDGWAGLDRDA